MKNDPRSVFSNLSNWKEEAWKKSGLQRDSNLWPRRDRCDALPTELWSHTLGARSIFYNRSSKYMNYFIYTYIISLLTGRYELCGFIARLVEHRTGIAEVTGWNHVKALIFFRLLLSSCLNWKIHCEDHSSLSSINAVQNIWIYFIYTYIINSISPILQGNFCQVMYLSDVNLSKKPHTSMVLEKQTKKSYGLNWVDNFII